MVAVLFEEDDGVWVAAPIAGDLACFVRVMEEPEGAAGPEAALLEPGDDALGLVGLAGGRYAEAEERETDNYADTRAFYRALGFVPLRELALESWTDRAVILARALP